MSEQDKRENEGGVPPGQRVTKGFPVLSKSGTPKVDLDGWTLTVTGAVGNPVELTWEEFLELPSTTDVSNFHCVTGWSKLDCEWTGVGFQEVLELVRPKPNASHVMVGSADGYTTNLALDDLKCDDVLLAYKFEGEPLDPDHGGPLRLVVPHKYAWKSAKWVNSLEFMTEDRRGYWEKRGYSNTADPWTEDRYSY